MKYTEHSNRSDQRGIMGTLPMHGRRRFANHLISPVEISEIQTSKLSDVTVAPYGPGRASAPYVSCN